MSTDFNPRVSNFLARTPLIAGKIQPGMTEGEAATSKPNQFNRPTNSSGDRVQESSLLDWLLRLLFDLQHNTKNPDQNAIAKILTKIQNITTWDNLS